MFNMKELISLIFACLLAQTVFAKQPLWPVQTYKTENFTSPVFQVNRTGSTPADPGYLFLGVVHPTTVELEGPLIVSGDGELVWHGSGVSYLKGKHQPIYNFQYQNVSGEPMLTYWTGELVSSHGSGSVYVLDQNYQQKYRLCLPEDVRQYVRTPHPLPHNCKIDKHESIMATSNSMIVSGYNATQTDLSALGGPKDGWVYDCVFYELELGTNKLLYQWNSLDHVPVTDSKFYNMTGPNKLMFGNRMVGQSQEDPWDYFHINSAEKIPGGYLVNSRYTWSFYILSETGDVQYTLEGSTGGDFEFVDSKTFFSYQHNARFQGQSGSNYSISIFNNDNLGDPVPNVNTSTGYLFTLDTSSKKAYTTRELNPNPPYPIYTDAEGSYQSLANDHVLIGYGVHPTIQEFDENNNLIYSAQFSQFGGAQIHTYRAYRLPWVGTPSAEPKIVVEKSGTNNATFYMSWNGATNHTQWNIMAGSTESNIATVAKNIPKQGFETAFSMTIDSSDVWKYIKVAALDPQSTVLAISNLTHITTVTGTGNSTTATTTTMSAASSTSTGAAATQAASYNSGVAMGLAALFAFLP